MGTSLLNEALAYLEKGYSIIPLRPGKKIPLIQWAEYQRRYPTREEVQGWWRDNPTANIGLITGRISGLVVVDVDVRHGGEPKSVSEEAPTGLIQQTGSGGYHFFYSYPDDGEIVHNRTSVRKGIDIRGDGGYVVVAPSTLETGGSYKFVRVGSPAKPPSWAIIQENGRDTKPDGDTWIADLLGGVGVGERNDALARLAGYYAGKKIPLDIARATLQTWNKNNAQPLPRDEFEATLRSIYKTETEKRPPKNNQKPAVHLDMLTAGNFIRRYGDVAIKWTIKDWLPSSTVGFLVSPPGGFKTWLLLDAAISIASGLPFLGTYKVEEPGPVLVFQQEDYRGDLARRFQTIYLSRSKTPFPSSTGEDFTFPALPPDLPVYIHPDRQFRIDEPSALDDLERLIKEIKPRLVLMDPLYSITDTDEYMAKTAEQLFALKDLRDRYQTSFMVAHHTRKSPGESQRGEMWGSQFLNAWLETGWQLRRESETEPVISLRRHFKAARPVKDIMLTFDIADGTHWRYSVVETEKLTEEEAKKNLVDDKPKTIGEIAAMMKWHRQKATRYVDKLSKMGLAHKTPTGKWKITGTKDEIEAQQEILPEM